MSLKRPGVAERFGLHEQIPQSTSVQRERPVGVSRVIRGLLATRAIRGRRSERRDEIDVLNSAGGGPSPALR